MYLITFMYCNSEPVCGIPHGPQDWLYTCCMAISNPHAPPPPSQNTEYLIARVTDLDSQVSQSYYYFTCQYNFFRYQFHQVVHFFFLLYTFHADRCYSSPLCVCSTRPLTGSSQLIARQTGVGSSGTLDTAIRQTHLTIGRVG